mgnify:CR=1 FL=1
MTKPEVRMFSYARGSLPAIFKDAMRTNLFEDGLVYVGEEKTPEERMVFYYLANTAIIVRERTLSIAGEQGAIGLARGTLENKFGITL